MYYNRSHSPASFSDGRNFSSYGKGIPFNYSNDFNLGYATPRNPSIQRVLNSGISERSRSPIRDYSSPVSRVTGYRPLPSVFSNGVSSPSFRRRDISQNVLSESRSSPVGFLSEDINYSSKARSYDFPSSSMGRFTSYSTTPIKKPQRTDYLDYLRPVLTARPTLKSGYIPKSRAERESDNASMPLVRERKLIKFRELTNDILYKVRRKISWDLPEEISSPLIDEMKQVNDEPVNEISVTEHKGIENEGQSSKDVAACGVGISAPGSPRHSVSRRSSGDQSSDKLPGVSLNKRQSPRSNGLIVSPVDGVLNSLDSKADLNFNVQSMVPIAPPRKKSLGSTRRSKKHRKSSIETLLSEEKSLNFSRIADDIRRSRGASGSSKLINEEVLNDALRSSQRDKANLMPSRSDTSNALDNKTQAINELSAEEKFEDAYDRGRRRRRRELIESSTSEEKTPETRTRCRSRFRPQISNELHEYSLDSIEVSVLNKSEENVPHPVSRTHRKSVKYKVDSLPPRRRSKCFDMNQESTVSSMTEQKKSDCSSKDCKISTSETQNNLKTSDVKKSFSKDKIPQAYSKKVLNTGNLENTHKMLQKLKENSHDHMETKNLTVGKNIDFTLKSDANSSPVGIVPKAKKSTVLPLKETQFKEETNETRSLPLLDKKTLKAEATKREVKEVFCKKTPKTEMKSLMCETKKLYPVKDPEVCFQTEKAVEPVLETESNENKEPEEIVVVCKLPQPKVAKATIGKNIPKEQNVVVSIVKNSVLKTVDVKEKSNATTTDVSSKTNLIIPIKYNSSSESEECDKMKSALPEVNVTHTIVLKSKVQSTTSTIQNLNDLKNIENGMHLKAIPDIVKSTVRSNVKASSDNLAIENNIILPKADHHPEVKNRLPDIKSSGFVKSSKEGNTSSTSVKPKIDDKSSVSMSPEEGQNISQIKHEKISDINLSIIPKISEDKDSSKICLKEPISRVNDFKENSHEKIPSKPDLIQMTTFSPAKKQNASEILKNTTELSISVEKIHLDKSTSDGLAKVKDLHVNNKILEKQNLDTALNVSKQNTGDLSSTGAEHSKIKDALDLDKNFDDNKSAAKINIESNSNILHSDIKGDFDINKNFEDNKFATKVNTESSTYAERAAHISEYTEQVECLGGETNVSLLISKDKTDPSDSLNTQKVEATDLLNSKQFVLQNKNKTYDQNSSAAEINLSKVKSNLATDEDIKDINKENLFEENDVKQLKRLTPTYKKSVTLPDVNAGLKQPNSTSKENKSSLSSEKKNKLEPISLSSGNVPFTIQEKEFVKNIRRQTSKRKQDREINFDLNLTCSETPNATKSLESQKNQTDVLSTKIVQFPKLEVSEVKKDSEECPTHSVNTIHESCQNIISINNIDTEKLINKNILKKNAFDKNIETDELKAKGEIKNTKLKDTNEDYSVHLHSIQQPIDLTKTETLKIDDQEKYKLSLTNFSNYTDENTTPKPETFAYGKDKQILKNNLKTPLTEFVESNGTVKDLEKSTTDSIHSLMDQNSKAQDSQHERVDNIMNKENVLTHLSKNEVCKQNFYPETKNLIDKNVIILHKDVSAKNETSIESTNENLPVNAKLNSELITETRVKIKKDEPKVNISSQQDHPRNKIKVTNESYPSKLNKAKEIKPSPVPTYGRIGLFLRPKETPARIVESSSSSEDSESETEPESSDEETLPVNKRSDATNECNVTCHQKCEKHMPNLCGVNQKLLSDVLNSVKKGKSPDRCEKNRNRSETSNTSIYSNISNSTTYTTFSTSSLDDEFGSPIRKASKSKTLRFRKYNIDDFSFLKLLGKGSFGKVLLAELKDDEMFFAIKCLKKDVVLEDDDVESTMIERRVLALGTQHPYMCKLYCTFQTKSYLFFVMEYLNGGDLMFHIQESRRFEEKRAMFYGAEIVSALKFLHKRGIVYRDIKLDNVMLDEQGHVRLVDFGMCQCRVYREECMPSNFCGTPTYIAPEIILGQRYNQSVDWWSFGVLLYEMLTGRSPFHGTDEDELFWSICNEEPHYPRFLSKEAIHIFGLLFTKLPNKRLGMTSCPAGDIKDHAFFSTINWDKIEKKQVPPPFKPSVSGPCDTSNFDSSFTMDAATLSPVDNDVLESMDQEQFDGFSYTNPHITD